MTSDLQIEATTEAGQILPRIVVEHGEQPDDLLARAGWEPTWVDAVREGATTVLRYAVSASGTPVRYRRTATYALVIENVEGQESVLLTSFTDRPDLWGLPGGGLDEGEAPLAGLVREVWEETGQKIDSIKAVGVDTDHWVGRSPAGRLEDFHAVRLLYRARCRKASAPIVHDIGGSTDVAQWVPIKEALTRRMVPFTRKLIELYPAKSPGDGG